MVIEQACASDETPYLRPDLGITSVVPPKANRLITAPRAPPFSSDNRRKAHRELTSIARIQPTWTIAAR